jgi:hypothetical protein
VARDLLTMAHRFVTKAGPRGQGAGSGKSR